MILSMANITVKVPDERVGFFLKLLQELGLAKEVEVDTVEAQAILDGIRSALEEVAMVKQGKAEAVGLNDFLDEL